MKNVFWSPFHFINSTSFNNNDFVLYPDCSLIRGKHFLRMILNICIFLSFFLSLHGVSSNFLLKNTQCFVEKHFKTRCVVWVTVGDHVISFGIIRQNARNYRAGGFSNSSSRTQSVLEFQVKRGWVHREKWGYSSEKNKE